MTESSIIPLFCIPEQEPSLWGWSLLEFTLEFLFAAFISSNKVFMKKKIQLRKWPSKGKSDLQQAKMLPALHFYGFS